MRVSKALQGGIPVDELNASNDQKDIDGIPVDAPGHSNMRDRDRARISAGNASRPKANARTLRSRRGARPRSNSCRLSTSGGGGAYSEHADSDACGQIGC